MEKYLFSILIILALILPGFGHPAIAKKSVKMISGKSMSFSEVDNSISHMMENAGVTGLSCAIINDSKVVYQKAYGFRNNSIGVLNDEETIFSAASFSKTVFAYIVVLLVEDGIIDLDKPLQKYLDKNLYEYPNYEDLNGDQQTGLITARMVLSHSTGFPNWRFLTNDGKLRIMFEPGSRFSYSGEGICLLQMAIEKITGKGLEELSRKMVFEPLGMEHTSYVWQKKFEKNFAVPHDEYERPKMLNRRRKADAAGSMQITAGDYARFLSVILNAKGKRKRSMNAMLNPQIAIRSENMFGPGAWKDTDKYNQITLSWGLGWGRFNTKHGRAFFHTGHDLGWQNYTVTYFDKGLGVVLLSNSDNFESVAREIVEKTIGDEYSPFDWLGYPHYDPSIKREPPPEPAAIDISSDILTKYIGEYIYLSNRIFFIKMEDNQLFGSYDNETWVGMYAESKSKFFMKGEDARFTFIENDDGKVTGFIFFIEGIKIPVEKVK
ncbi:MAG: serine hydrolase [Desulfobacteraceae bacterium]|nr:serine hydrolase [Desulfobacteraceae bacterium]